MQPKQIVRRVLPDDYCFHDGFINYHPVLKNILAYRGVRDPAELSHTLDTLLSYHTLKNIDIATDYLSEAIIHNKNIIILGDYDVDGATSTALAVRALKSFGASNVNYLNPSRFREGYGVSKALIDKAHQLGGELLITVDMGISDLIGIDYANQFNLKVIITDHHLPGEILPNAATIINPNQLEDNFSSKNLAGVGVIFYVLTATRAKLREKNWFAEQNIAMPSMAKFLDLVALGTIADVVALDQNNRILVSNGLKQIKQGKAIPGIRALIEVAGRSESQLTLSDLGFAIAPRLNAAGRLDDISLGVECLLADDFITAKKLASQLDELNTARRSIDQQMHQQVQEILPKLSQLAQHPTSFSALCLFDETWHEGTIGILAGRLKDQFHRPVLIFAAAEGSDLLKGSGRSIPGLHLRDLLSEIAVKNPRLIEQFGGHAAAAGVTIRRENFENFQAKFIEMASQSLTEALLKAVIYSDGELSLEELTTEFASQIAMLTPWGQAFPEPLFDGHFDLVDQRLLKSKHIKFILRKEDQLLEAILFFADLSLWPNPRCKTVEIAYRLATQHYRGERSLQLIIETITAVTSD